VSNFFFIDRLSTPPATTASLPERLPDGEQFLLIIIARGRAWNEQLLPFSTIPNSKVAF
jgi:hypothetical protein